MSDHRLPERDRPWVMRTYAGHSDARRSNELYRSNLAKGQTGLSVAFDLPTQTGYDPDHILSRGEVGKVGVSGGTGYVFEYRGEAIRALSMEARMTICNMSIEAGARAGMVAPDETTFDYINGRPNAPED